MLTYYIKPQDRIPKEELLLGNTTVVLTDCEGNQRIGSGLIANDLMVKQENGTFITFMEALKKSNSADFAVANAEIELDNGGTITIKELAEGLQQVHYEVPDLQAKYDQEFNKN